MRATLITQPVGPGDGQLGEHLRRLLRGDEGRFTHFMAAVAYAKSTGVARVYAALRQFQNDGGQSSVSLGINQLGTSVQALTLLRNVVDELFIYYDRAGVTFHPKVYLFEARRRRATIIVGSGNLTSGGLFTNYEANIRLDFDLRDGADARLYREMHRQVSPWFDVRNLCVRPFTDALLEQIRESLFDEAAAPAEGAPEDEAEPAAGARGAGPGPAARLDQLFGTAGGRGAPRADIALPWARRQRRPPAAPRPGPPTVPAGPVERAAAALTGFWKVLSAWDVNPHSAPGQIQIPIQFRDIFPPTRLTRGPDAGGRGRQWERSFPVRFRDGAFARRALEARFIVYEPRTGHARPNTECRFTFHDRPIFDRLAARDILVFRRTEHAGADYFEVERLSARSRERLALTTRLRGFGRI